MSKLFFYFLILSLNATAADSEIPPFRIAISQEFETLHPLTAKMLASNYLYSLVGRPLVYLNTDGKWAPQLAEQIPSFKNGRAKFKTVDGRKTLEALWEIKKNARWSDGKPVICEDFQLARDIANSPNVTVDSKETYTQVSKVQWSEKEPQKCTFIYDKPRWNFYQLNSFYPLPSHLEKSIFQKFSKEKEAYERNSLYVIEPWKEGLHNGPYKISEVKLGSHVSFVVNPYFFGPEPKIKKIIFKLIPQTSTLEANLRSGTVDAICPLGFSFDQALNFEKKIKSEHLPYVVSYIPSISHDQIALNLENPILQDLRVRKALVHAINRENLVSALFEGKQLAAHSFLSPLDPWATEDPKFVRRYSYDKAKSQQLLDEAGWKMNTKDGFRYQEGKKLSLQLMGVSGNQMRETLQSYLQSQWKDVGVEILIKNHPSRVFFSEVLVKRKFGGMAIYGGASVGNLRPTYHSSQIPLESNSWSGQNFMAWKNPKVDQLIEKVEKEFDSKKQATLVHEVIRHYTEEIPSIPLFYRASNAVIPVGMKNFKLSMLVDESNEVEHWSLEK